MCSWPLKLIDHFNCSKILVAQSKKSSCTLYRCWYHFLFINDKHAPNYPFHPFFSFNYLVIFCGLIKIVQGRKYVDCHLGIIVLIQMLSTHQLLSWLQCEFG